MVGRDAHRAMRIAPDLVTQLLACGSIRSATRVQALRKAVEHALEMVDHLGNGCSVALGTEAELPGHGELKRELACRRIGDVHETEELAIPEAPRAHSDVATH